MAAEEPHFREYVKIDEKSPVWTEWRRVSYPKFKNGEATVRNVKITPNFGRVTFHVLILPMSL